MYPVEIKVISSNKTQLQTVQEYYQQIQLHSMVTNSPKTLMIIYNKIKKSLNIFFVNKDETFLNELIFKLESIYFENIPKLLLSNSPKFALENIVNNQEYRNKYIESTLNPDKKFVKKISPIKKNIKIEDRESIKESIYPFMNKDFSRYRDECQKINYLKFGIKYENLYVDLVNEADYCFKKISAIMIQDVIEACLSLKKEEKLINN